MEVKVEAGYLKAQLSGLAEKVWRETEGVEEQGHGLELVEA